MRSSDQRIARVLLFYKLAFKTRNTFVGISHFEPETDDTYSPATFIVDYVRYRVTWKHNGTSSYSDHAIWDDGFWPDFFVLARRRRGLIPWKRDTWVEIFWASGNRTLDSQLIELGLG